MTSRLCLSPWPALRDHRPAWCVISSPSLAIGGRLWPVGTGVPTASTWALVGGLSVSLIWGGSRFSRGQSPAFTGLDKDTPTEFKSSRRKPLKGLETLSRALILRLAATTCRSLCNRGTTKRRHGDGARPIIGPARTTYPSRYRNRCSGVRCFRRSEER